MKEFIKQNICFCSSTKVGFETCEISLVLLLTIGVLLLWQY